MARVISALMIREMITRYGRSWGGYLWAVAEPIGMIALLTLAFSQFLRTPPLGTSFVIFYTSGFLSFYFFQSVSQNVSIAVTVNRALMRFPAVSPLDAVLARAILQLMTMVVVTVVILVAVSLIIDQRLTLDPTSYMISCLVSAILGLGIGTLNVVLFAFIPFYRNVWAIVSRPLFLVSGIFYTVESMPDLVQTLLILNPLVHVTGLAHIAFYPTYDGAFVNIAYPLGLGVGTFLLGGALILRHRSYIIENS